MAVDHGSVSRRSLQLLFESLAESLRELQALEDHAGKDFCRILLESVDQQLQDILARPLTFCISQDDAAVLVRMFERIVVRYYEDQD